MERVTSRTRNLVLTDGGHHEWQGIDSRTHQIDMHGQSDCWGFPHYCGTAGEYMDIRHNTIAYTAGAAIKIRGEPTLGLDVARNVFSHSQVWGGYIDDAALVQTEGSNLRQRENRFGQTLPNAVWVCPFEEPGLPSLPPVPEGFLATGETWWIAGSWGIRYLNSSTKMIEDVVLGDTDGDRRCDVSADGLVSRGGRTPLKAPARTDIVWRESNTGRLRVSLLRGAVGVGDTYPVTYAPHRRILGTGDFDGDGDHDILSRVETGQALEETFISFMVASQHELSVLRGELETLGVAEELGLASLNRTPLAMGLLSGRYRPDALPAADDVRRNGPWWDFFDEGAMERWLERIAEVRAELTADGRSLVQGALGWIWGRSPATLPLPGFRTVAQVRGERRRRRVRPASRGAMERIRAILGEPQPA